MNTHLKSVIAGTLLSLSSLAATAAEYVIDTQGAHASVNFKIQHLGYSWLTGRFNEFSGKFNYDAANPEAAQINVVIDTDSLDSNHAERDKHLRSSDFLSVSKYPKATFTSTKIEDLGNNKLKVHGDFTLHGTTKPIVIDAQKIGEGADPWGGYRAGFAGSTTLALADFGIEANLGPASTLVEIELHVEGVKQ